jgi:hypothetical protein
MISVSIISIVILIFVLHTILTHLINWLWRVLTEDGPELAIIPAVATLIEAAIMIKLLNNFIQ